MKINYLKGVIKTTRIRWGCEPGSSKEIISYEKNNSIVKYDETKNINIPYKKYEDGFIKRNTLLPFINIPYKRYEDSYEFINKSLKPYKKYEDRIN